MVDLVFGVHGARAGDDLVATRQRLGTDELQQQAGDGPVVVAEDDIPVGQCLHGAVIEDRPFGRDGRQQPQLLAGAGRVGQAGEHPGAEAFGIAAHLFKVGAAGFGAAAVQQEAPG